MAPLIFVYNIFLIVIYTCAAMLFLGLFSQSHQNSHLAVAGIFSFYVLDNAIVYMAEFISSFSKYYSDTLSDSSIYKTIILSVICFCYLFVKVGLIGENAPPNRDWLIYGLVVLWLLIVPELHFSGNIWFYYIAESLFQIYLCASIFFYWIHHGKEQPELTKRLSSYRYLLMATPLLAIGVMVEDAIVLFQLTPLAAMTHRIRQRNICEDILSLVFVGYAVYAFFLLWKEEGKEEAKEQEEVPEEKAAEEEPEEEKKEKPEMIPLPYFAIDDLDVAGFSKEYGLTKRETQVLRLLLEDKSNQEMQEILVIAPGTVKNHIHNIYSKTNVSKRSQLLLMVSEFTNRR